MGSRTEKGNYKERDRAKEGNTSTIRKQNARKQVRMGKGKGELGVENGERKIVIVTTNVVGL